MSDTGTGSTIGSVLTSVVLPVVVGGILGGSALGGLVYSQTQGPDTNPASQEILVYGD
ncbi:hypothetical protein SAMN04489844_3493 [Nocardioides exalbidus]|uniref:Uncharacterized protein n=1 Tax=Nocardioides exalbidus TaxID=402596 RepID=A0A1H4X916_9ACTN|nr:hypothetical protein [Nocardioides exalbidus]SED02222.1 hypothetical protein SAMN04489844_3493 [Nocardioides exalbidus]